MSVQFPGEKSLTLNNFQHRQSQKIAIRIRFFRNGGST